MVILVFFVVISVNRRLFRYFGSYSGISVIPIILVSRRTGGIDWFSPLIATAYRHGVDNSGTSLPGEMVWGEMSCHPG